jgi:hypothetical protein
MAFLLGLLSSSDEKPGRLRSLLGTVGVFLVFLIGLVLPLVWVPYMAWAFRQSGIRMGARASAFYAERRSEETGVRVKGAPAVHIAITAGVVRMVLLIALPIVVAVTALLTDVDIGSGKWVSAAIFLVVVSGLVTSAWLGYRRWRRARQGRRPR